MKEQEIAHHRGQYILRPMQMADAERILAWRNQPHIREAMFTTGEISLEDHLAWMERTITDKQTHTFIYEDGGHPLGYVKIEEEGNGVWRWGFYIGHKAAVKGSGSRMLCLALDHIFDTCCGTNVKAQVKPDNPASIRIHERLGFIQTSEPNKQATDITLQYAITAPIWRQRRSNLIAALFHEGKQGV
jgi:RimJ/RimL family protein N-acetyltransferase